MMRHNSQKGFTLVELSIVLVIIGLIVGGVLVGQDLIKAAQVRAVVSQLQGYDAAINTFRTKYNGLPGDFTRAAAFNLGDNGNGNGLIDSTTATEFDGEMAQFWRQLSQAGLVGGSYQASDPGVVGTDFPETKLGKGGIVAFSHPDSSFNFWAVGAGVTSPGNVVEFQGAGSLTPAESFSIDAKLDDGSPDNGIARAIGGFTNAVVAGDNGALGGAFCMGPTSPYEYNVSSQTNECTLSVRISG